MRASMIRPALFFFALVFAYLQYVLWFEDDGIFSMMRLKRELAVQTRQNEALKQKNQDLVQQVERLKKDPEVAESRARGQLGMIRKGEKFYQIVK